jgi:hypothetical protein
MSSGWPRFWKRIDRGGAPRPGTSPRGGSRRIAQAWERRGLPPLTPSFAAFALLTAILAVAVVLALATPGNDLTNLGRNLLTTLAVALLAYLWFYVWTGRRATDRLRSQAAARPESLFAVPPRVGRAKHVFGRQPLIEEIARKATSGPGVRPQLIVGDTGSGKTSLLLALADHLAQLGILPIVISLRDAEKLDFVELAEARFKEDIDPHIRTATDAEKLWRWMRRQRDIVVLADDLDRAKVPGPTEDPYKTAARLALEAARHRELALVVTSRPEGLPRGVAVETVALGPLQMEVAGAVQELLKRVGRDRDEDDVVHDNVAQGKLTDNPFYLGVVTDLLRLRSLQRPPAGGDEHTVRVALLNAWREALLGRATVSPQERERREQVLDRVADFAAARLPPEDPPAPHPPPGDPPIDRSAEDQWLQALHAAERFDLVEVDDEGRYRFKHDAMHAYFASRVLTRDRRPLLAALRRAPDAPRVQLALVFAAAATYDPVFCKETCESLLATSAQLVDEQRLLRAAAAAEVASAGAFHELDDSIAATCVDARRYASPLVRRSVLTQIAKLSGECAVKALWEFACDDDYGVRWAAAKELVDRCSGEQQIPAGLDPGAFVSGAHAYGALAEHIAHSLEDAERSGLRDEWTPEILPLKHIAWILPRLRTQMQALKDHRLDAQVTGHLKKLIELESTQVTHGQKGLEASLAQGFKADAWHNRTGGVDEDALALLGRAEFWYSQLNLLHAITLRAARSGLPQGTHSVSDLLAPDRDPRGESREERLKQRHPFLRAAAELCDEALAEVAQTGDPEAVDLLLDRYVWEDEGKLVSGPPGDLVPDATQLVGDIVVLLNMNEIGDEQEREDFGRNNELPHCMGGSRDRRELFEECAGADRCKFRLCPYEPVINRLSAHREISRSFCLHQQRNAKARVAKRWGSKVEGRALRDFWDDLESKARI